MFPEGGRFIDQAALAQADPVSLKVALMSATNGNGLLIFAAAPTPFFLPLATPESPPVEAESKEEA